MNQFTLILIFIFFSIFIGGCELNTTMSRSKKASDIADMNTLENEVKRLRTELDLLNERMDRYAQEQEDALAAIKSSVTKMETDAAALKTDVDAKISASEDKQTKIIKDLDAKIDSAVREVMAVLGKMKNTGASSGSGKGFYHTVAEKESPWSIAQKYKDEYGVTAQDILDANGLKSGDPIQVGQKLFIPIKK